MSESSPATPREPGPPGPSRGLLGAILSNPGLRQQLGRMPADEKTIAVTSENGADFSHPSWTAGDLDSAEFQTIELPPEDINAHNAPMDAGFVPKRGITNLGDEKREDADYRIVGQLGAGGTAIVYQAHQRAVDREVAVKVLRNDLAYNALSRQRFLSEARVIGALDHPNVIAIHEVCLDDRGGLFYSMKRIDGTSWDQRIAEMSLDENISTLLRVANAIRYAHSRGLIHRDIKPENVMLGRFGEVLLADWGLAISYTRDADDSEFKVAELDGLSPSIGGTPAYMAPELAMGNHSHTSFQTDVYLLGATLYQILTGNPPHEGNSLLACIHAAAHNELRPTEVEGELIDIAYTALSTNPEDRYESVDAFMEAIQHQRKHAQSAVLVRHAQKRLAEATHENRYEDFRLADVLLTEALDVWPSNQRALTARKCLQLKFAETATARGDLDLAWSIYESAGEAESDAAMKVREAIQTRDANQNRSSRYSALFDFSPEAGLLISMATGIIIEANHMFGCLFGYSADEIVGRKIEGLNLWACPERRNELVDQLTTSGAIDEFEATFLHQDSHKIVVLMSARVVDVEGEAMIVATFRDISQRKQAELDLKRSRERLREFQSLAGLGTWAYDVVNDSVTCSQESLELMGRTSDGTAPTRDEFYEMIHPDDRGRLEQSVLASRQSGEAYQEVVRFQGADQEYRPLLIRGKPIVDDQGEAIEIYGVLIPQ
ncbi:MAG: protein kinase [Rubripirellula sp.]